MAENIILSNRYQLQDPLGSGGMAIVYRAKDLMLERTVAIKLLRKDFSNNPQFRQQFRQEAKAAANLSHPNIVTVHDFGLDSNQLFIIMEYVPGTDLKAMLKQNGRFSVQDATGLMMQACAGIGYAHRAGLVHCDIKPQNMLVTPDNLLKVVDFGIARALAGISPDEKTEVVWGSPHYFSPEQAAGNAPSPASDVYSLGVVLYEMLVGQTPFKGETPEQLADQHLQSLPPSMRKINQNIPVQLEQIILKTLAKEPANRYQTADQLANALQNYSNPVVGFGVEPAKAEIGASPARQKQEPLVYRPVEEPVPTSYAARPVDKPVVTYLEAAEEPAQNLDWVTWGLALLALLAAGGLVPFLLWVFYVLNPPI